MASGWREAPAAVSPDPALCHSAHCAVPPAPHGPSTLMGPGVLPGSHPTFLLPEQGWTVSGCQQTEPPACPPNEGVWRSHGHNTGYGVGPWGSCCLPICSLLGGVVIRGGHPALLLTISWSEPHGCAICMGSPQESPHPPVANGGCSPAPSSPLPAFVPQHVQREFSKWTFLFYSL